MSAAIPVIETWDGLNRRAYLKQGVSSFHWMDDIYPEYRQERRLNEAFRKWEPMVSASGNISKGLGKATPRLLTLLDGFKVIPYNEAGIIQVNGEAITDDADVDATLFDVSALTTAVVLNYQPPSAEVIVVDAIAKALDYSGVLHYNENSIYSGQDHPIGTSANPVNNLTDGIAIAIKYGLLSVVTFSDITLTQDVQGFTVSSVIPNLTFYPNGFKAHLCKFNEMRLDGDFNDSLIKASDCNIIEALNVYGVIKDSLHSGKILISANQNLNMTDCESGIPGLNSPEVDMNAGNAVRFGSRNFSGGQKITNCDIPADEATLSFSDGGKPHIEPSCTDGILSIRGSGELDDRSAGTTIDTQAWMEASDLRKIYDLLTGDVIPTPTLFTILHRVSKEVLLQKDATEVNGLTQLSE